MNKMLK